MCTRDFAAYAETKRRLVRFALDDAILGFDDPVTREMATVAQCRVHQFGLARGSDEPALPVEHARHEGRVDRPEGHHHWQLSWPAVSHRSEGARTWLRAPAARSARRRPGPKPPSRR